MSTLTTSPTEYPCNSGLSIAQACSVASQVGVYFVAAAKKCIWQPQCDVQVLHECSLLITQRAKTQGRVQASVPFHHTKFRSHVTHVPVCWLGIVIGVSCPLLIAL